MQLRDIQQALKDFGFYAGAIDGDFGPGSQRALMTALKASLPAEPDDPELLAELTEDEGIRPYAYTDSKGYLTIGRGRLVDKRKGGGLSQVEIDFLTANDLKRVDADLDRALPWWRQQTPARRRALRSLCFNMGIGNEIHGLLSLKNSLSAWRDGDFERAAVGFATSKWATDVQPSRRDRIVRQIRTGA